MRQTRRKRSLKRVKWLGAVLLVIIVAAIGWHLGTRQQASRDEAAITEDDIVHVMIMGVDRRADDVGRSDTLMIASVDRDKNKAALLSVPRDTRVELDGHGYEKINHAYAYGGHKMTQQVVEKLLAVNIDHYILIDTRSFERIVDAIGGVDIDVEKRMYYEDPWDDNGGLVIDLYPGEQHLDGERAIQYVRYRDGEGDIGRIARQQKFMQAVLEKLITPEVLPRLPKLVGEIASAIETDMSVPDLLAFAKEIKTLHANGLAAQMVPGRPAYIEDVSYWIPAIVDTRELLVSELGLTLADSAREKAVADEADYMDSLPAGLELTGEVTSKAESNAKATAEKESAELEKETTRASLEPSEITVMVINDSGINGAGAEVADILKRKGFKISSVETGRTSSREQTVITTSERNTDVFYGMPFDCIIMEGGTANQAVIHIGLDYRK